MRREGRPRPRPRLWRSERLLAPQEHRPDAVRDSRTDAVPPLARPFVGRCARRLQRRSPAATTNGWTDGRAIVRNGRAHVSNVGCSRPRRCALSCPRTVLFSLSITTRSASTEKDRPLFPPPRARCVRRTCRGPKALVCCSSARMRGGGLTGVCGVWCSAGGEPHRHAAPCRSRTNDTRTRWRGKDERCTPGKRKKKRTPRTSRRRELASAALRVCGQPAPKPLAVRWRRNGSISAVARRRRPAQLYVTSRVVRLAGATGGGVRVTKRWLSMGGAIGEGKRTGGGREGGA